MTPLALTAIFIACAAYTQTIRISRLLM